MQGPRVALITGAAGGIGKALAGRFAAEGYTLALADRDARGLAQLAAAHPTATIHVVDLSDAASMAPLVDAVVDAHGGLSLVAANAGWTVHARFEDMTPAEIDGVMDVDLRGVMHLLHHALPHLSEGSHIVLTSSMAGFQAFPFQSTYSAAKHGLAAFGDALGFELGARAISVTTLLPGTIATPFLTNAGSHDDATRGRLAGLMERYGTSPDAVARAALRGMRRGGGRIRVGWDAHLVGVLGWAVPPLIPAVLRLATRRKLLG